MQSSSSFQVCGDFRPFPVCHSNVRSDINPGKLRRSSRLEGVVKTKRIHQITRSSTKRFLVVSCAFVDRPAGSGLFQFFSVQSLSPLCLCGDKPWANTHHRVTENTEAAQ